MRLDKYLSEHGFSSRTKASRAIADGRVCVNGRVGRASDDVSDDDTIFVRENPLSFVSEGGYKLRKALDDFRADICGRTCVDLGASTGGFTDCLLQAGAELVFAVDVGKNQLSEALRNNSRVRVLDEVNVRYLHRDQIDAPHIDVVTADLSFISLKLILPAVNDLLDIGGEAFVLVKPQFECGGKGLNKHGILKDKESRHAIVYDMADFAARLGLDPVGVTAAPLREKKNVEYILRLYKNGVGNEAKDRLKKRIFELD